MEGQVICFSVAVLDTSHKIRLYRFSLIFVLVLHIVRRRELEKLSALPCGLVGLNEIDIYFVNVLLERSTQSEHLSCSWAKACFKRQTDIDHRTGGR